MNMKVRSRVTITTRILSLVAALAIVGIVVWHFAPRLGNANEVKQVPDSVGDSSADDYQLTVRTIAVGDIAAPLTYSLFSGVVQPRRESQLGFRRAGRVTSLLANEGDRFEAAAILGQLDVSDLAADRERLEAEARAASARLLELRNGPREQSIASAKAEVTRLQAIVDSLESRFQRQRALDRRDAGTQQELDDARYNLEEAHAALESAKQKHHELVEGTRPEQLAAAAADLAVLQAAIRRIDVDISDCQIVAPYGGTVSSRLIDEGTIVTAGQTAFDFLEMGKLEVRIGLPVAWASHLAVGDQVQIEIDAAECVEAEIVRMLPRVDPVTRNRHIDVTLPSECGLIPGQVVSLKLIQSTDNSALSQHAASNRDYWLPTTALAKGARGLWSVYAVVPVDDNAFEAVRGDTSASDVSLKIERRDVQIKRTTGDLTCVSGMLNPGDSIVCEGVHRVSPGILVRASSAAPGPDALPIVSK